MRKYKIQNYLIPPHLSYYVLTDPLYYSFYIEFENAIK